MKLCCGIFYTVLQNYAHIGLKQNLLRSITLDIITRLLDNAAFVCIHMVGRSSKDFSEVRWLKSRGFSFGLNGRQQHCARSYEKRCRYPYSLETLISEFVLK